jgi:hypothetical protein
MAANIGYDRAVLGARGLNILAKNDATLNEKPPNFFEGLSV